MIYFMQSVEGGPVKIGYSENVTARRSQLESHYGEKLAILATRGGGKDEERAIHARFGHLRFGKTEQFRPERELMDFIGRPLLVAADPESVETMKPTTLCVSSFKGSEEFAEWLRKLSDHCRLSPSQLIEHALVAFAKEQGMQDPAPRR